MNYTWVQPEISADKASLFHQRNVQTSGFGSYFCRKKYILCKEAQKPREADKRFHSVSYDLFCIK